MNSLTNNNKFWWRGVVWVKKDTDDTNPMQSFAKPIPYIFTKHVISCLYLKFLTMKDMCSSEAQFGGGREGDRPGRHFPQWWGGGVILPPSPS